MKLLRSLVLGCALGAAALLVPAPAVAAPPEPSAVSVSATDVAPGDLVTVAFEVYNPETFTVSSANATLLLQERPITEVFELVSCTGGVSPCFESSPTAYRGPVGDLLPAQEALVEFTFRVRESAPFGAYTIQHVLLGGNFAFPVGTGPVVTVSDAPSSADVAVALAASPRGVLTSRITYTVTVANHGPADATAIRIEGTYAGGLAWANGNGCVRDGSRSVVCEFASIPSGTTASASFSVNAGLLALGSFTTSVWRDASSPADPDGGNDSASRTCTAVTGLLVLC